MRALRILVVDDHEIVRKGICALLREEPRFELVCEAGDGLQAVTAAKELQPDIVVLDINMPGMGGLEAAGYIKKVCPKSEIVFLSQHSSAEVVRQAFRSGGRAYVAKDAIVAELITAIRMASEKKDYVNPKLTDERRGPETWA
jgi:DNA-binding NarL/FixJ family response regulator